MIVPTLRRLARRAWNTLRPGRAEHELARELDSHLALIEDEYRRRGLRPDAARRAARLALGGLEQAKEQQRSERGFRPLDDLRRDVVYAVRMLRRRPVVTVTAILSLAVGLGLNAAVFSVVDWVLLRPLPYPSAHELVHVFTAGLEPATGPSDLTEDEFRLVSRAAAFRESAAFTTTTRVLTAPGVDAAYVLVARVAGDLFATLGVRPHLGHAFTREELTSGLPVVIVGHSLWQRQWLGSPDVIGRSILLDGVQHTIVGVMPADRGYPRDAEVWRPRTLEERGSDDRELTMLARLRSRVSGETATAEVAALVQRASAGRTAWVDDVQRTETGTVKASLQVLFVTAMLALLVACANVAALIGGRAGDRADEVAMRAALGATRARIFGQLITESVVLATAGGTLGLLLGRWALDILISTAPVSVPRLTEVTLDARIIAIGLLATLTTGLVVGLAPALRLSRSAPRSALTQMAGLRSTPHQGARHLLVLAQVAAAVVLTTGAGFLMRTLYHLVTLDHGFSPDRLVAVRVYPPQSFMGDVPELLRLLSTASEGVPGVEAAAWTMRLPTQVTGVRTSVARPGESALAGRAIWRPVSRGYFETVGLPLTAGRVFSADDRRGAPLVAVVNQAFVRDLLGGRSPLGMRLRASLADRPLSVVGVVGDVTPAGEADLPALYLPVEQAPIGSGHVIVRTRADPGAVIAELRERLRAAAPGMPFARIERISDALAESRAVTRFLTQVAAAFASLALLLSAIGVYGLAASTVSSRRRETAVRLAMGASHRQALWTVVRPCVSVVTAGALLGAATAIGVRPALSSLIQVVDPGIVISFAVAPILLSGVGLLAALAAAAHVLWANPAAALRSD